MTTDLAELARRWEERAENWRTDPENEEPMLAVENEACATVVVGCAAELREALGLPPLERVPEDPPEDLLAAEQRFMDKMRLWGRALQHLADLRRAPPLSASTVSDPLAGGTAADPACSGGPPHREGHELALEGTQHGSLRHSGPVNPAPEVALPDSREQTGPLPPRELPQSGRKERPCA